MSERSGALPGALSTRRQTALLLVLWWRQMRRRATRIGAAPKVSGVPSFLLLNLIGIGYLMPIAWRAVLRDMDEHEASFAWHIIAMLMFAFGTGATKAAGGFQLRGSRNDAFLEPIPLNPLAALALQLSDGLGMILITLVIALAGARGVGSLGVHAILPTLLGGLAYVAAFTLAYASVAAARAVGPTAIGRYAGYGGVGLSVIGFAGALLPVGMLAGKVLSGPSSWLTGLWLRDRASTWMLYAAAVAIVLVSYRGLLIAERINFDRLPFHLRRAPKATKEFRARTTLEWLMMWRVSGKATVWSLSIVLCGLFIFPSVRWGFDFLAKGGLYVTGLIVYLGAILLLTQAGRSAHNDLMARAFLSALPLSPHQTLDGKARALRKLVWPLFCALAVVAIACVIYDRNAAAYRAVLALASLYLCVEGAIGIAFLSAGVGIVGIAGGQASSSFTTQLLMMPLLATVLARNHWTASVSFIAVLAVTLETRRAARLSVRWIDDPDESVERETTVWRALLAATAFFATQVLTASLLMLFDVPLGYLMAGAFGISGAVLALLTWRNGARLPPPRFSPRSMLAWPLGVLSGGLSGFFALKLARVLPPIGDASAEAAPSSSGELIATFVTMVVMAPVVEEYFFRGWLQRAIEKDLPEHRKRFAFAFGALAFALAHIGSYGLPQLVLGLIAGALYAFGGGLWPAILAHAMHNGVVLLSAP
jgi:membrane protease YdiL (CAAX protease family)